jgi:HD-GYP domain-containing protein (c-di-GMP phosphodiesterase class II)
MTFINNLTTLFTTPLVNTAPPQQIGFRGGVTQPFQVGVPNGMQDVYTTNPLYSNFRTKEEIEQLAKSNPRIMQLLKEYGIPLKVNIEELEALKKGHLQETRVLTAKMSSILSRTYDINPKDIQTAAMLHDYGKVLIPLEILNKPDKLTPEEKKIMNLHSEFGYELLKQQGGVNENVLKLVKYHHQKPDGSGYPAIVDDYTFDISTQIIEIADMYSALTEERPYHKACSKEDALECIHKRVESGEFTEEVFEALKNSL